MHTSRPLEGSQGKGDTQNHAVGTALKSKDGPPQPIPVMPSYESWADHELKKQIAAFGFKPVKKAGKDGRAP